MNGTDTGSNAGTQDKHSKALIGISVRDVTNRRLVESASSMLDLAPVMLKEDALDLTDLLKCELIVGDLHAASSIRSLLYSRQTQVEAVNPAILVVGSNVQEALKSVEETEASFDGVLNLPQSPGAVATQLSVILYAHRAFAKRFESAMEELHLNRRIFNSVTSGISISNASLPDLPLTYVNPAFEVITGYSFEEIVGQNCRFLQGPERDQPAVTLVREAIRDRREVTAILKNFKKDGTPFWNELSLSPIRNREGEMTHFVGIQTDVTARVEFEVALRESEKLAAVGRLASSIAHEINNPLEGVMNLVYIALQMDIPPEAKEMLTAADHELQRVKTITSQSLRFYKQSTLPQAVRCAELLEPVLKLYASRFNNGRVTVEKRERSTQSVVCMESEVRQVLSNLVSNAIDAMSGTGGCLKIRTRDATDWQTGGKGVSLTFADTGSGIEPDVKKNIFKAFFTTKGIRGTGLGLWISKEIVERHGGKLKVRTSLRPGKSGTVFELFLPSQGA